MSIYFRHCWMDFDICYFELASLDVLISANSRFKPVGGEIWYPAPQCKRWSQKAPYCFTRKNVIFLVFFFIFSNAQPDVVNTQKAQCKNTTRKKKHNEKYFRENDPKRELFLEFCFAQALARPKNANISHKVNAQNIVIFSMSETKNQQKFDPLRNR